MKRSSIIYGIYVVFLVIFMGLVVYTPYLALSDPASANPFYSAFSLACHQKISRSQCIFEDGSFGDCTLQNGTYIQNDQKIVSVDHNEILGFKLPVCARDVGLYVFMLLSAFAYPFIFKMDNKIILHPAFLVLAVMPLALDGGLQFLSDVGINLLGFPYESTNLIRMITGAIAGIGITVFALPILNKMFN